MTSKDLYNQFKGIWPKWKKNPEYIISPTRALIVNHEGWMHISDDMDNMQTMLRLKEFKLNEDCKMIVCNDTIAIKYE